MKKLQAEKKAKEAKEKKEQALREAKEKRDAEMRSRQEAQVQARAAAAAVCGPAAPPSSVGLIACNAGSSSSSPAAVVPAPIAAAASAVAARQPPRPAAAPPVGSRSVPPPQRAVISVTGLSPRIAKEEIMRRQEYFGQYGKILRVLLNNVPSNTPGPPSFSCQITYSTREEAEQAILAVDGVQLDGRKLKATHTPVPAPPIPVAPSPGQPAGSRMPSLSSDADLAVDAASAQVTAVANAAAVVREAASREAALARDEPPVPAGSRVAVGGPVGPVGPARDAVTPTRPVGSRAVGQHTDRVATPGDRAALTPPVVVGKGSCGWGAGDASPMVGTIGSGVGLQTSSGPSALLGSSAVASLGVSGVTGVTGASSPLASLGADLGPPLNLGSDLDPILLGSGFEALLSGLGDDDEVSEVAHKHSRFARFFAMEEDGDEADDAGASALYELRGVPLGGPDKHGMQQQGAAPRPQEDWQEGFRALLPNVNISFSGGGGGGGLGGLSLSGLDAIAGFPNGNGASRGLGGLDGGMGQPGDRRAASNSALNGLGGNLGPGADLLAQLAAGGNGSGLAGLGGVPLTNSLLPLSSQLQNLLQCSGADASSNGDGVASLHSLFGGSGGGAGLIPGWATPDSLTGNDDMDPIAALGSPGGGKGGIKKEPVGAAAARNDKPKKRGGAGSRGGKVEVKTPQK
jgi:hypothetical protein